MDITYVIELTQDELELLRDMCSWDLAWDKEEYDQIQAIASKLEEAKEK